MSSSAQMFRTGLVHADPHEGNMLFTDDGKLALLDFGLICRVDDDQQEAMANCILNILNSQWGELIDNLTNHGHVARRTADVDRRKRQPGGLHARRPGVVEGHLRRRVPARD